MKTKTITTKRFLLPLFAIGIVIGLASWGTNNGYHFYQQDQPGDTPVPKKVKTEKSIRDLDQALDELDHVDIDHEMEMAQREISRALSSMDMAKIQEDVQQALKNIDMAGIQQQIDAAMKEVDSKKIQEQVQQALKDVNMKEIQENLHAAIASINTEKIKEELQRAQTIDLKQLQAGIDEAKNQLKNMKPELEKQLQQAKGQIEKAKAEVKAYKDFVDGLAADGLVDKKSDYSIEQKDGDLYINGKKADASVRARYSRFLDQHKDLRIKKTGDSFSANIGDEEN